MPCHGDRILCRVNVVSYGSGSMRNYDGLQWNRMGWNGMTELFPPPSCVGRGSGEGPKVCKCSASYERTVYTGK